MTLLSSFLPESRIRRDAEISLTFRPSATTPGAVCYANTAALVGIANANSNISAVITTPDLADLVAAAKGCVESASPREEFYTLHNALCRSGDNQLRTEESFVHPTATLAPGVVLGQRVSVGPGVRIGAGAVLEDNTIVGENTVIGAHVVIGGRGLYNTFIDGRNVLVECAGGVRIGRRCEILSTALIQRSYLCEFTEIGDDSKLAPGASVGHGCRVGRATSVGARAVVGGNTSVGDNVWIGPSSVIADALMIGNDAQVKLGSVVVRNVNAGETVSGNFALSHAQHLRIYTRQRHGC